MSKHDVSKKSKKLARAAADGCHHGRKMHDMQEAALLEDKLRQDHMDVVTRCTLVGFYSRAKHGRPDLWCNHFEWLVKTCTGEEFLSAPYVCRLPENISDEQYKQLQDCYLQKVKRNRKNANVLGNAATFIEQRNFKLAQKLLKKAVQLEPKNEKWLDLLCHSYSRQAIDENDIEIAEKAFDMGDHLLKMVKRKGLHEAYIAEHLCELAFHFNDLHRASRYIARLKKSELNVFYPSRKHLFKGMLALRLGDVERAKTQLLKAGHKEDLLMDLTLARQLQDRGEFETVMHFLELCLHDHHIDHQKKQVAHWIAQLKKGKKVNLVFTEKST